jgi:hypothetical protein
MRRLVLGTAALAGLLAFAQPAVAQPVTSSDARQPFMPGVTYDARVPTVESVLGHAPGDVITPPDQIVTYFKALAQAAPDRTRLIEYGRTWEGRPLIVLAIASPARMAQLDQVKAGMAKLADPRRLGAGEGDQLVRSLPVVVWLMHAVHGNEISSSDAALMEAYHLLAAQGDAQVAQILENAVVLIDPLENPDGRARFVASNSQAFGVDPDPEPASAEHVEPWPGGRANHYLFDMNRDWFAQSQLETQGRTKFYLEWFPQVVVDLHEMGGDSTYYFAPPADPLNPQITQAQVRWFNAFGKANGDTFDARGYPYFIREVFDSFYPGYGESWPIFHGSIGMTYEMASSRGLAYRRDDETVLTYRDGVERHFVAAITTAATAAANREAMLRDFLAYRQSAIQEGEKGAVKAYVIPRGHDLARSRKFAELLQKQGFDVHETTAEVSVGARRVPAGAFVVPAAQPAGRLLVNLLDASIEQPDAFVKEQDRRRKKRLSDQIYDVTGWHLPSAFDVDVLAYERPVSTLSTRPLAAPPAVTLPQARAAYVLPWGSGTAALVVAAQQRGIRVHFADQPFTLAGRAYPIGTAIVRVGGNPATLSTTLADLARTHHVEVVPADSTFVDSGISLGSNDVVAIKAPRVLLAWDTPTSSQSAGWTRYVLERQFGQRVSVVRVATLGLADLSRFDVVVLPSGNYAQALNGPTLQRLKDWISAGGTLVTMGEASRWATREGVALLETSLELKDGRPDTATGSADKPGEKPAAGGTAPAQPIDLDKAVAPKTEPPDTTFGALIRVTLDTEHWLSAGTDGEVQAMVEGRRVFTPLTADKGRNVGTYSRADDAIVSGLVWPENKTLLANKAFLMHQPRGQGHVIAFAEEPNFRAFMDGTALLFMNAVLLGPAH